MKKYDINEVLQFLNKLRSRKELMDEFDLSNSESFNLLRWLEKAKLINVFRNMIKKGYRARFTLYKSKK